MSIRLSRAAKKRITRERLLLAAARVFARKGFPGASLDDVAEAAGLTKGAIYSNFHSKQDLLLALVDATGGEDYAKLGRSMREVTATAGLDVLATHAAAKVKDVEWNLLMLELVLHAARMPALRRALAVRETHGRLLTARMIEELMDNGDAVHQDRSHVALMFEALGLGLALKHLVNPNLDVEGALRDLLIRLFTPSTVEDSAPST